MLDLYKQSVIGQFEAALCMLNNCLERCPSEHWDGKVAKYTFWQVAYHTLCYIDCYLAPSNDAWQPHPTLHPLGRTELEEEYPSRRFTQEELLHYVKLCREKIITAIAAESAETLKGPSGFSHLSIPRAELHLYNLRHVQHHTGQLTAFLRRVGVDTFWVKKGWREK